MSEDREDMNEEVRITINEAVETQFDKEELVSIIKQITNYVMKITEDNYSSFTIRISTKDMLEIYVYYYKSQGLEINIGIG